MTEQKRDLPSINEGWEERLAQFNPADLDILVGFESDGYAKMGDLMTAEEMERTLIKFRMVEEFARRMAWGFLKGTAKYPTDHWSAEEWQNAEEDEEFDLVNYRLLRKSEQQRRMQEAWEGARSRTVETPTHSHCRSLVSASYRSNL